MEGVRNVHRQTDNTMTGGFTRKATQLFGFGLVRRVDRATVKSRVEEFHAI